MGSSRRGNPKFAEAILQIIGSRSLRQVSRLTGISHTYVDDLKWGIVPSYQVLQQFAAGIGLDADATAKLFEIAGYEPIPSPGPAASGADSEENPLDYLQREVGAVSLELARQGRVGELDGYLQQIIDASEGGFDALNLDEARARAQRLRELAGLG